MLKFNEDAPRQYSLQHLKLALQVQNKKEKKD